MSEIHMELVPQGVRAIIERCDGLISSLDQGIERLRRDISALEQQRQTEDARRGVISEIVLLYQSEAKADPAPVRQAKVAAVEIPAAAVPAPPPTDETELSLPEEPEAAAERAPRGRRPYRNLRDGVLQLLQAQPAMRYEDIAKGLQRRNREIMPAVRQLLFERVISEKDGVVTLLKPVPGTEPGGTPQQTVLNNAFSRAQTFGPDQQAEIDAL